VCAHPFINRSENRPLTRGTGYHTRRPSAYRPATTIESSGCPDLRRRSQVAGRSFGDSARMSLRSDDPTRNENPRHGAKIRKGNS
jgi:hypothetical protein